MKYLIVGLGNIGDKYHETRHNIGFMVVDSLANKFKVEFLINRHAYIAEIKHKGKKLILLKPTSFMNLSGKAVIYWMTKEKIALENIIIIVDDIALPLGELRMRIKGGDGNHNGLNNIINRIGTPKFARLRVGIGDSFVRGYQSDFVLGKWTQEELNILNPKIDKAVEMILSYTKTGIEKTMSLYHKSEKPKDTKSD